MPAHRILTRTNGKSAEAKFQAALEPARTTHIRSLFLRECRHVGEVPVCKRDHTILATECYRSIRCNVHVERQVMCQREAFYEDAIAIEMVEA